MRNLLAAVAAVLLGGTPAFAQDQPLGFNFGGGAAFPVAGVNNSFNTGWNWSLGLTWNLTPEVGVLAEYMYDRLGGPDRSLDFRTFNLVYKPRLAANERALPIGVYTLGGGGIYHRLIQLTTPSIGFASVCDPYWFICYPTLVPVDTIIGDRSSNDFGINFGAGVTFGGNAKFYVESRYHYVWGPKVANPVTSQEVSTNAGYFPLTFGVRW
jgi:opacity protein-like surface antigen